MQKYYGSIVDRLLYEVANLLSKTFKLIFLEEAILTIVVNCLFLVDNMNNIPPFEYATALLNVFFRYTCNSARRWSLSFVHFVTTYLWSFSFIYSLYPDLSEDVTQR